MNKVIQNITDDLKKVDWRNYKVWVALAGLVPLALQAMGITKIPTNYADVVNTFLAMLVALGILTNPSINTATLDKVVVPTSTAETETPTATVTTTADGPDGSL